MDLSILIPVFNGEDYILDCVRSIEVQDFTKGQYEVLIVNDGSTDNTQSIIEDCIVKNSSIKLYNQSNKGNAYSRNKLFDLAIGEYIYCLDADDYLVPKKLNQILKIAYEGQFDLVPFLSNQTSHRREEIKATKIQNNGINSFVSHVICGFTYLAQDGIRDVGPCWYLINRKFLNENEIRFKNLKFGDVVFTHSLFLKANTVLDLPVHVHWYYQSPNSTMRSEKNIRKKSCFVAINNFKMIFEFSELISTLENTPEQKIVKKRLKKKRDNYIFFNILIYARSELDSKKFKSIIKSLENKNLFPIKTQHKIQNFPIFFELLINVFFRSSSFLFLLNRIYSFKNFLKE